jgi:hypothetical protein
MIRVAKENFVTFLANSNFASAIRRILGRGTSLALFFFGRWQALSDARQIFCERFSMAMMMGMTAGLCYM